MPTEPCALHNEFARQIREMSVKLDKLLEQHNKDEIDRANRLSTLEAKVSNLTYVVGVCGVTIIGRIVYDIWAGV